MSHRCACGAAKDSAAPCCLLCARREPPVTDGMDPCGRCGRLVQVSELRHHACRPRVGATLPTHYERVTLAAAVLTLSQLAARARQAAATDPAHHTAHTATALRCERIGPDLATLALDLTPADGVGE